MSYPQPYGQGRPPAQYASPPTNTLAVVSLASGIASYFVIPIIGALVAIISGHIARGQIRRTGEGGATFALIGLILGYLHFAIVVLVLIVLVIVFVVTGAAFFANSNGR